MASVGKAQSARFFGRRWVFRSALTASLALLALGVIAAVYFYARDPEASRLARAIAQFADGASTEARPLFLEAGQAARELLRDCRDDAEALDAVARLYQRLGNSKEAVRCWQRCIELDPALSATAHAEIASLAFDTGDLAVAVEHYRAALQHDPASTAYPVHLGEALINQGQPEEAVRVLEEDLKSHPRSMPTAALLGQAYLQLRQYAKARQHLESSVQMSPDYPAAYHGLITACAQLGDNENSRQYRQKFEELQARKADRHRHELKTRNDVERLRQTVAGTYADAARVYLVRGAVQVGEQRLLRARTLAPNGAPWLLMLAALYEQQGRRDEALAILAEASQRASPDLSAQIRIAAAFGRLGSLDRAEESFRQAMELAPYQGSSHAALAQLFLQSGRKLPEAKLLAQAAVDLEPAPEYWFLLSQACLRTGDRDEARRAIAQAIDLDPGNAAFRQFREHLARLPR